MGALWRRTFDSAAYWENRYRTGGTSGSGSYGLLAEFKARVLNGFVREHELRSVIEFGCGDGHQLSLADYPLYTGLDVSAQAIALCHRRFQGDATKSFLLYSPQAFHDGRRLLSAELALSLDVLFHLVELEVYEKYLLDLFSSATRFVVIYASNVERRPSRGNPHELRRKFTRDVARLAPGWRLQGVRGNDHPPRNFSDNAGSLCEFYFYEPR